MIIYHDKNKIWRFVCKLLFIEYYHINHQQRMKKAVFYFYSLLFVGICSSSFAQDAEANLLAQKIELPGISKPIAAYINAVRVGNLLYLSGKIAQKPDGTYITGKLGKELSIEQGYEAAKWVAITHLAVIKNELGSLNKVKRIVKVLGFINSSDSFYDQPKVLNGYSELMLTIFGEKGKHARSAIGVNALPMNAAVEVELIVEIEN